jgi:hypothetical protein
MKWRAAEWNPKGKQGVAHKSANGRTELGKHKKEESQG